MRTPDRTDEPAVYANLQVRRELSFKHLRGNGIEIGPWSSPLDISEMAHVKYVDIVPKEEHIRRDPGFVGPEIDILDDGEVLGKFEDESLDFVVANHFFEHCLNPIGTLRTHLSKLRKGGLIYYAIPDKRFTFDRDRPLTTIEHLLGDDVDNGASTRRGHYREWAVYVDRARTDGEIEERVAYYDEHDFRIHFHVWDETTLMEFFEASRGRVGHSFDILEAVQEGNEVILIIRNMGIRNMGART